MRLSFYMKLWLMSAALCITLLCIPFSLMQSASATSITCPGALPSQLVVGGEASVNPGEPNNARAEPALDAERLFQIPSGEVMVVLDGPVCADGYAWWLVSFQDQSGWTVEATADEYFLSPVLTTSGPPVLEGSPVDPTAITVTPAATLNPDPLCVPPYVTAPQLEIGQQAHLRNPFPQAVFSEPRDTSNTIGQIEPEDTIEVLDGPVCGDYLNSKALWFEIQTGTLSGWVIEGYDNSYLLETGALEPTLAPEYDPLPQIHALDWSSDGRMLAVGTRDGLYLFATDDFDAVPEKLFANSDVPGVAFHPNEADQLAVTVDPWAADEASMLYLINTDYREILSSAALQWFDVNISDYFIDHPRTLSYSADGQLLFDTESSIPYIYSVDDLEQVEAIDIPKEQGFTVAAISPDGQWVAANYAEDNLYVGALSSDEAQGLVGMAFPQVITNLQFAPQSDVLVVADQCSHLRVIQLSDGASIIADVPTCLHRLIVPIEFSPARPVFYTTTSNPRAVEIYETADLTLVDTIDIVRETPARISTLAVNPTETLLAVVVATDGAVSGEGTATIAIIDLQTKEQVAELVLKRN